MPLLRVNFVPRWPRNPYHDQLARHLAAERVEVGAASRLKDILQPGATLPDVVHVHALPPFQPHPRELVRLARFWLRLRELRRRGVRLAWTVHNVADHESRFPAIDRAICRRFYRSADAVFVHSEAARAMVEAQWSVRSGPNVTVVHHGHFIGCYPDDRPRADARRQLGLADDELVFLFLGNIRPYKGVTRLVHDFRAVATPRMRLVIAGEPLHRELQHEIEQAIAGSPQIIFHPRFIADADLQSYLHAADAMVFPYTRTLTSGALILAMSFGLAGIAPRMGALADTLDAEGGFFFEPDSADGLRRALAAAAAARSQLPAMGAHNRRRAAGWGWDEAARLTSAGYRRGFAPHAPSSARATVFHPAQP